MSFVLAPSCWLRLFLAALGFGYLALAAAIALGWLGAFHGPLLVAGAIALAGGVAVRAAARPGIVHRLDVDGRGRLRLAVQGEVRSQAVRLQSGSTLWPWLLVLHLGDEAGATRVLVVLPDCLPGEEFRRLVVAIRAIAAREDDAASLESRDDRP